tara:strand:- start:195 stop:488 length:294 start_codon:yes stop_codon:yes gene_type:complete
MAEPKSKPAVGWVYEIILRVFGIMVDCFFRDIQVRGVRHVPTEGSVILVAAPHANQVSALGHMTSIFPKAETSLVRGFCHLDEDPEVLGSTDLMAYG